MKIQTDHRYFIETNVGELQVVTDDGRIEQIHFHVGRSIPIQPVTGVEAALLKLIEQIAEIPEIK